jgi:hypothetical protein
MGFGSGKTKNLTFLAAVARCSLAPLSHWLHRSGANLSRPGFRTVRLACLALLARPALSPAPRWSSSAFFATPRLILLGGVLNRTDFAASTPTRPLTFCCWVETGSGALGTRITASDPTQSKLLFADRVWPAHYPCRPTSQSSIYACGQLRCRHRDRSCGHAAA